MYLYSVFVEDPATGSLKQEAVFWDEWAALALAATIKQERNLEATILSYQIINVSYINPY